MSKVISSSDIVCLQDKIEQEFSILNALIMGTEGKFTVYCFYSALTFQALRIENILEEVNAVFEYIKKKEALKLD